MNAIGYIRISTKDQSQYSLEYQERNVRQYCQTNNLDLLALFKDDGESSYTFDRPDWIQLEKFIKKNRSVSHLVIFDHDRFSRNLAEALMKIKELQDKFGIKVLATTDSFDTDFSDPSTFLMRAFKYMMAEGELWRIRQRTKAGMVQAALNGRYVSKAPFGYKNTRDPEGKPMLIVDDEKAFIIRMIFQEYNRGLNIEEIKKKVTPYGYNRQGNSALQNTLGNPVYAGLIRVPAHRGKPETIQKALHKGIVSEAEYWNAQKRLQEKKATVQKKDEVPLRGVLKCAVCGRLMTAGNSKGRTKYYWYYMCNVHRQNFSATKLHDQLNEILDLLSLNDETIEWFKKKLSDAITTQFGQRGELLAQTQKALRSIQDKMSTTEERYLTGDVSKTSYNSVVAKLRNQQIELQKRLFELETDQQDYWDKLTSLLPKLHDLRGTYEALDLLQKQQLLNAWFDNSLMHDGESYRTAYLDPMFVHNALILNERRLLIIEQPSLKTEETPVSAPYRNPIESLLLYAQLFAA